MNNEPKVVTSKNHELIGTSVASAPVGFEPSGFALEDDRVDLGGGAVLDVYARAPSEPAVALSFGHTWVRVFGHPPSPSAAPDGEAPTLMSADADLALDSNPE